LCFSYISMYLICQVVTYGFESVVGIVIMVTAYCNILINPLIYATQYNVVKHPLANYCKCNKHDNQQPPAAN